MLRSKSNMLGRLPKGLGRVRRPLSLSHSCCAIGLASLTLTKTTRDVSLTFAEFAVHATDKRARISFSYYLPQFTRLYFFHGFASLSTDLEDATLFGGSERPKMGEITQAFGAENELIETRKTLKSESALFTWARGNALSRANVSAGPRESFELDTLSTRRRRRAAHEDEAMMTL